MPIKEINGKNILWSWDKAIISLNKPPLAIKTNFFRLLAVGQKVGLWLRESLISISRSETHTTMKSIIDDLIDQINQWVNLADAMSKHTYFFDTTETELVRAAQGMGNLPETLEEISNELENYKKITSKIKGALSYPITLLIFAAIATGILLVKVIPTIVDLFPSKEQLPGITLIVLDFSDFMIEWRWLVFGWLAAFIITYITLYKYFLPFKILIDGSILKIPVISDAIRTFYMYRFSKLLGDFIHAWVDQISAMKQIANIFDNFFYKKKAQDIQMDLWAWFTFADTIEWSDLFDPILVQIIVVGEQTGNLWETLQTMSWFYKEHLMNKINAVMWFIEPILLAGIAVIIWSIVASIFLPMADLVNVIAG